MASLGFHRAWRAAQAGLDDEGPNCAFARAMRDYTSPPLQVVSKPEESETVLSLRGRVLMEREGVDEVAAFVHPLRLSLYHGSRCENMPTS
jgi:hypothetical protein